MLGLPSDYYKPLITNGDLTVRVRNYWLDPWNDFRTKNWSELTDYPELLLKESQELLSLYKVA
jgi:hypothetical protein